MTSADPYREWDAAYVLGALEPEERREFERHLEDCPECQKAVTGMAGMPGLLSTVPFAQAVSVAEASAPDERDDTMGEPAPPLARVADAARRRRSRGRVLFAAVAAGVVLVAGVGGWAVGRATAVPDLGGVNPPQADGAPSSGDAPTAVELLPTGETDIQASLVITPTTWGSRFDWTCDYPRVEEGAGGQNGDGENIVYTLVVVDDEGRRSVAATWSWTEAETSSGLGASSALPLERIDSVEIGLAGVDDPLAAGRV